MEHNKSKSLRVKINQKINHFDPSLILTNLIQYQRPSQFTQQSFYDKYEQTLKTKISQINSQKQQILDLWNQYNQNQDLQDIQSRNLYEQLHQHCQQLKTNEKQSQKQTQELIKILQNTITQLRQVLITKQQQIVHLKEFYTHKFSQQQTQNIQEINQNQNRTQDFINQLESSFTTKLQKQVSLFQNESKDLKQEIQFLKKELLNSQTQKDLLQKQIDRLSHQNQQFQEKLLVYKSHLKSSSAKKTYKINYSQNSSKSQQQSKDDSQFKNIKFQSNQKITTFKQLFSQQNIDYFERKQKGFSLINQLSKGKQKYFSNIIQLSQGYDKQNINFSNKSIKQFRDEKIVKPFEDQTQDISKNINICEQQRICYDPYYAFYVLTIQCIKMNSSSFDQIADIKLSEEWQQLLLKRIGMNNWYKYLKNKLSQKVGFQV